MILAWIAVSSFCLCRAAELAAPAAKDEPVRPPRQQLKPDRLVADNVFLYISTPDLRKARTAFERTAFRALLKEDDIAQPLLETSGHLRDAYVRGDGTRSEAELRRRGDEVDLVQRILPLLDGQIALAMEGDPTSLEQLANGVPPRFLLVASLPPGEEGERRVHDIQTYLDRHRAAQGVDAHYIDREDRVGSYDIVRIENPDLHLVETWAFVENLFVYGQGKRIVEDAIDRFMKNSAGSLARHAGYQSVYDQVGRDERGDAPLYVQMDIRPLGNVLANLSPVLQAAFQAKAETLEATRPHMALGMFIADGENAPIREKVFMRTNPDAVQKKYGACNAASARFVQGDAIYFRAEQGCVADVYTAFLDGLKRSGVEGKDAQFNEYLRSALGVVNMQGAPAAAEQPDVRDGIVAKLGVLKGEMSIFLSYVAQPTRKMDQLSDYMEMLQPVFCLELNSDDPAAETGLRNTLNSIQQQTGQEYVQTGAGNAVINYQRGCAPREERASSTPNGLFTNLLTAEGDVSKFPFFAAHATVALDTEAGRPRKFLLLSDSLNAIKKAVQQVQPQYMRSSLAEDPRFKDLGKSFRESRFSMSYLDLPRLMTAYNTELPKIAKSKLLSRNLLEKVPSMATMKEHVFPMGWASTYLVEPAGVLTECASPLGNLPLVGLIGTVSWPTIVAQRQKAVSDEVDEKFKRIMLAMHLYAADFDRFPPQVSDLYNYAKKDLKLFESPFKRGALKTATDLDNPDLTNLIYVPSHSLQDLGTDILLYEKEPTRLIRSNDGYKLFYHVLTIDGKKSALPRSALERLLTGKLEIRTSNVTETPKER